MLIVIGLITFRSREASATANAKEQEKFQQFVNDLKLENTTRD